MKNRIRIALIITTLLMPLTAEEIMKITLTGKVSEESLSTLSKIVFEDNTMVAGSSYNLDEIEKIEFYNDGNAIISDNSKPYSSNNSLLYGQIGFSATTSNLSLTLPKESNISVSLFSISGRKVAELFSGNAHAGKLDLNLTKNRLATGIYSVVVKANNTIFVRKLVIK